MAKTRLEIKPGTESGGIAAVFGVSYQELVRMLEAGKTREQALANLRRAGIVNRQGKLAKKYRTWGKRHVSYTLTRSSLRSSKA